MTFPGGDEMPHEHEHRYEHFGPRSGSRCVECNQPESAGKDTREGESTRPGPDSDTPVRDLMYAVLTDAVGEKRATAFIDGFECELLDGLDAQRGLTPRFTEEIRAALAVAGAAVEAADGGGDGP
ncbi:hypothetical protein [Streptomyces sp. NPDC093261]|uniref:hypothetical protein n=1 Tax=Streptomyces sp. NPDC093261 TaxID=3366037 RepID=UPI00382FC1F1